MVRNRKLVAGLAGMLGAGAVATSLVLGSGFSLFTSTAAPPTPQSLNAGTVVIGLGAAGTSTGDALTIGVPSGMKPGDTVERAFTLSNSGTINLSAVTLGLTVSTSNVLTTDATNGLQLEIQSCSVAWTASAPLADGGYTYTCSGTTGTVLASTPAANMVSPTTVNLTDPALLTAGGSDNLMTTVTFPSTAGNTFQGLSASLTYNFAGTQVAGSAQ